LVNTLIDKMSSEEVESLKPETRDTMKQLLASAQKATFWNANRFEVALKKLE